MNSYICVQFTASILTTTTITRWKKWKLRQKEKNFSPTIPSPTHTHTAWAFVRTSVCVCVALIHPILPLHIIRALSLSLNPTCVCVSVYGVNNTSWTGRAATSTAAIWEARCFFSHPISNTLMMMILITTMTNPKHTHTHTTTVHRIVDLLIFIFFSEKRRIRSRKILGISHRSWFIQRLWVGRKYFSQTWRFFLFQPSLNRRRTEIRSLTYELMFPIQQLRAAAYFSPVIFKHSCAYLYIYKMTEHNKRRLFSVSTFRGHLFKKAPPKPTFSIRA